MKSVLISIQPKWCELIASGKKTVEVRKTKPKLETPFKVYIYCTKSNDGKYFWTKEVFEGKLGRYAIPYVGNGCVIGEFVCDRIGYVRNYGDAVDYYDCIASCLSAKEIIEYATDKNGNFVYTYGWHISDLVIYDKPRELSGFYHYCGDNPKCDGCEAHYFSNTECGKEDYCCSIMDGCKPLKRPPQSWCYVEVQG